jgi:hypothetical protein
MRKSAIVGLVALPALLSGCGGGTDNAVTATSATVSMTTSSAMASSSTTAAAPTMATPTAAGTPEQQFISAMETSGVVPQLASPTAAVGLALAVCVAFGSGRSFPQVVATLAGGGRMSLGQEMDIVQAATQFYCPRFYVPGR